jgi:hypothetical protein
MIAFGTAMTAPDVYRQCAEPGIKLAAEPDSVVLPHAAAGTIFRGYNLLLDRAAELDDLEALVLVHQDAQIVEPEFCRRVRAALSDPDVGVVGCVGAIGVRSIAWWEGAVTWASFAHRYGEYGGGDLEGPSWDRDNLPPYAKVGEVDTVDGFVMALSPWVVRNVRFDESIGPHHGYDFDFCLQVRAAGRKVVTADFRVIHHHSLDLIGNAETWIQSHALVAEKWDGQMPNVGKPHVGGNVDDWKKRARRAEGEAACAHGTARTSQLKAEAREKEFERYQRAVEESISWKLTAPLRRAKGLLKRRSPEAS